jgi:protein involved in polysaccharide export with SLBB domain
MQEPEEMTSGPETEKKKSAAPAQEKEQELPPQPPTEFQRMVNDSVGQMLPIFGASLFRQPPSTFAPLENVPVPADYVIGPGDELYVRVWGQINVELRATVDRNGEVFVPKVGTVMVAGEHVSQLDGYFRQQIERVYRNFDVAVTLGKLRSMNVFFVGRARRPGNYTIGSLSTLVNAIFAAGGPAAEGSMRHIQLKRDGQLVTDFDMYDLLLKGDKSKDVQLLPGDVIYIPPAGPQVAIAGSVNTPAIYELKDAQTTLGDAIELAGGITTVADGTKAAIERIDQHQTRSVTEFPLDRTGQQVKDGDIVRVLSIVPRFENAVTLRGNVANPGRYPWHAGMKIRDLIPDKEMLLTRNYWASENALVRGNGNGGGNGGSGVGESELRTDVKLIAPEINWDYASILRLDPVDLSTTLIPFSLGKAVLDRDEASNVELRAGDVVTIFSQHDLSVSQARQTMFVRVEGEVHAPGIYKVEKGETLRSVLEHAGGLTDNAYLFGTQLTRESARIAQQAALDRLTADLTSEVQERAIANARSNPENAASTVAQTEAQKELVNQMRGAKAVGRIVIQLKPTDTKLAALPSIVLEDSDRILIPPKSEIVSIVGSVFNQSSFLYKKGTTVGYYTREAGNGSANADFKHALLVRANGSVLDGASAAQYKYWRESLKSVDALPGDTIVIPPKLEAGGFSRALRDWAQVASQASIAAAVVATH